MASSGSSSFLRRVLVIDATLSGVSGLLLALDAAALEGMWGAPAPMLRYVGLSLLPFAALVAVVARRERPSHPGAWTVIGLNVAWVVASGVVALSGRFDLTALGLAFVVGQAIAVAGVAELEYVGLRKAGAEGA
jgi:hypothetical protein